MDEKQKKKEEIQDKIENVTSGILKVKKALLIGASAALLILTLIFGGTALYANIAYSDYSNNAQVEEIAEVLDCDLSYASKKDDKYLRLEHNGNKPIYVCLDDALNAEERHSIIKSLDTIFGLVGQINPKYRYEIVDQEQFDSLGTKTKIYYTLGQHRVESNGKIADANAHIERKYNWLSFLTTKRTMNEFVVSIDREKSKDSLEYDALHETLHLFGDDDVFTILTTQFSHKHQGNTLLQPQIGEDVMLFSPNDVRLLISQYAPKFKNDEEKQSFISQYTAMLEEYDEIYYSAYASHCKENYYAKGEFSSHSFTYQNTIHYTQTPELNPTHIITVNENQYTLEIYNRDGVLLDSTSGEVYWKDGVAILRNVTLEKGLKPGIKNSTFKDGYVQDLALIPKGNFASLVDLKVDSDYTGRVIYQENEIENKYTGEIEKGDE